MTASFDERNMAKSRRVCEAMAETASTGKRVLTERERRLLSAWPRHEGSGRPVWLGDSFADEKGELREIEGITLHSHGIDLYDAEGFHKGLDYGERLKRPVQSVLDADGVEIKVGDTVYDVRGERFTVQDICGGLLGLSQDGFVIGSMMPADQFSISPRDSWERFVEDLQKSACTYFGYQHKSCDEGDGCPARGPLDCRDCRTADLVRRANALRQLGAVRGGPAEVGLHLFRLSAQVMRRGRRLPGQRAARLPRLQNR